MEGFTTLGLLAAAAIVVLGMLALTIRFDPAARARRRREEAAFRRASADLLREAQQLLRQRT